jgi:hypothetical protein
MTIPVEYWKIRLRRDTTANWTDKNPILDAGEVALEILESGAYAMRIGDGIKTWTALGDNVYETVAWAGLTGVPASLTSIAGLTTDADKMIYTTAANTYAVASLTAAGRALLDDVDSAAQLATLGIPLLATSGITGALTLSKTGETARTATFPDAAIVVAGSAAALTADRIIASTTGGLLSYLDTATYPSLTELAYVKGVTSGIQSQLNGKEPTVTKGNLAEATSSVLTIVGGTGAVIGSGTTIQVKEAGAAQAGYVSTGAQTMAGAKTFSTAPILSSLTASQILALDGSGNIQSLAVATYPSLTELSYVKGVTSAIQTQLGTKVGTAADLTNVGRMVRVSAAGTIGETDISVGAADGVISRAGALTVQTTNATSLVLGTNGTARYTISSDAIAINQSGSGLGINTAGSGILDARSGVASPNAANLIIGFGLGSINYHDANNHVFRNGAGAEGMRIASGQVLIGTTAAVGSELLRVAGGSAATAGATDVLAGGGCMSIGANLGIGVGAWGTSAAKVVGVGNGTAPSSSPTDMFQMYSADQAAGNACPHFRTEGGAIIKLYQQAEITDELTTITHTAPGTPDYAIQDLTDSGGFGFATKDEGNTVLSVIANLQARVNELETVLVNLGVLVDAD